MIDRRSDASSPHVHPHQRIAVATVVGGITLPAVLLAWVVVMSMISPDSPQCSEYLGCLVYLEQAWKIGRWVSLVVAWPLLHLLRVRPSWPVAIVAGVFVAAIWQVADALLLVSMLGALTLILFSGAIAYPAAAWLTMPRVPRKLLGFFVGSSLALYACAFLLAG
ncbi:hypothetical protein [Nonomuraea rubra]|uniref:hypothetical protein n=1 Tax=Nonomuraea rubra TaxID=46180 RepID=UPI003407CC3D